MIQAKVSYIAASANRHAHTASLSNGSSLIAFGSEKFVALWDLSDPSGRGVLQTLPGHEADVTCVASSKSGRYLASGDEKGSIRLWQSQNTLWKDSSCIQAHARGISALKVFGDDLLVSGSSDGSVKVWAVTHSTESEQTGIQLHLTQTIDLKGRFPLDVAISKLPGTTSLIMAISCTHRDIRIYTHSDGNFMHTLTLPGHEDWVKAVAFSEQADSLLTLASGSQDNTIRLWVIAPSGSPGLTQSSASTQVDGAQLSDDLLDSFETSMESVGGAESAEGEGGRQITMKRHLFGVKNPSGEQSLQFTLTFDALLVGHEAGVTSLSWRYFPTPSSVPTLLSTSTDSSAILWSPSGPSDSQLWIIRQRFGDVGGQRLGGFVGGLWGSPSEVLAYGWSGGWRMWRDTSDNDPKASGSEKWTEVKGVSGHSAGVHGIDWAPNGEYLVSAGLDQTTRIHGYVQLHPGSEGSSSSWQEIARPQVHGYDLQDASFISALRLITVADEKVARVFDAPAGFVRLLKGLGVAKVDPDEKSRPLGATLPPLGLSNKATDMNAELAASVEISEVHHAPFEGELAAVTLWPETEKLFGHGYELISLAASHSGRLVATACKATTAEHAVIRVYETNNWKPIGRPLEGHSLTVTKIAFSPDDRLILSVSRDRTWRLFELQEDGYAPLAADKPHARIIWDCAWMAEGDQFATAARDKTVKVWKAADESKKKWLAVCTLKLAEAATAVAFAPLDVQDQRRRLAVGLETGQILIYSFTNQHLDQPNLELEIASGIAHVDHVYRLAWRPSPTSENKSPSAGRITRDLASCSDDRSVRILTVTW